MTTQKNARAHAQDSLNSLNQAKTCLQNAANSAEKPDNKTKLQDCVKAVDTAINQCQTIATKLSQE